MDQAASLDPQERPAQGSEPYPASMTGSTAFDHTAHDLRDPLQAIGGYLDLTLAEVAGPLTDDQRVFLGRARAATARLAAQLDDTLLLARHDTGGFILHRRPLSLAATLEDAAEDARMVADDAGVHFLMPPAEDCSTSMLGDPQRLAQGLRDTLLVAVAEAGEGGTVTVSVARGEDLATITIAAHVPARPADMRKPAPALDRQSTRRLAVATLILTRHGGAVTTNVTAEGRIFNVALPRDASSRRGTLA